jgi:hypothetical protein
MSSPQEESAEGDVHAILSRDHGSIIRPAVLLNKLDLVFEGLYNLFVLVTNPFPAVV